MTIDVFCVLVCLLAGIFVLVFFFVIRVGLQSHYTLVEFARLALLSLIFLVRMNSAHNFEAKR